MIKQKRKIFTPKIVKTIVISTLVCILLLLLVNYTTSTLLLMLRKNYSFQIVAQDKTTVMLLHKKLADTNTNYLLLNSKVLALEQRLDRHLRN